MQIIKLAAILLVLLAAGLGIGFVSDMITEDQALDWGAKGGIVLVILGATGLVSGLIARPAGGSNMPPPSEPMK